MAGELAALVRATRARTRSGALFASSQLLCPRCRLASDPLPRATSYVSRRTYAYRPPRKAPTTYERERREKGRKADKKIVSVTMYPHPMDKLMPRIRDKPWMSGEMFKELLDTALAPERVSVHTMLFWAISMRKFSTADALRDGTMILWLCARAGDPNAVIHILAVLLRQLEAGRRDAMRITGVPELLRQLDGMARAGNARALSLQGRLAAQRGDHDVALDCFTRSLAETTKQTQTPTASPPPPAAATAIATTSPLSAAATKLTDLLTASSPSPSQSHAYDPHRPSLLTHDEFGSPWLDLAVIYTRRGQYTRARELLEHGVAQSDPDAHFNLAQLLFYRLGRDGGRSERWLYHMLTAAASGHFKAAYEVGRYYAETPFVRADPPARSIAGDVSKWTRDVRDFFTVHRPWVPSVVGETTPALDESAPSPYDPQLADVRVRAKIAREWFDLVALQFNYMPAYLSLGRLFLQRYIYPDDNLLSQRASADAKFQGIDSTGERRGPGAVENPHFDPRTGAVCVRAVLHAEEQCERARVLKEMGKPSEEIALAYGGPLTTFPDVLKSSIEAMAATAGEARRVAAAVGIDVSGYNLVKRSR